MTDVQNVASQTSQAQTEKLDSLFTESQSYYESFLDMNNLIKMAKLETRNFL